MSVFKINPGLNTKKREIKLTFTFKTPQPIFLFSFFLNLTLYHKCAGGHHGYCYNEHLVVKGKE